MKITVPIEISVLGHALGLEPKEYERAEWRRPKNGERFVGDFTQRVNQAKEDFESPRIVLIPKESWVPATVQHLADHITGVDSVEWRFKDAAVQEWILGRVAIGYDRRAEHDGELGWCATASKACALTVEWFRFAEVKVQ